jgi:hypothetical protein
MKKILIADGSKTALDQVNSWLHDAGFIVLHAWSLIQVQQLLTDDFAIYLIGDLGPGTESFIQNLRNTRKPILIFGQSTKSLRGLPAIPRRCTRDELLHEVSKLA